MKNRISISQRCPSAEDWQALLSGNLPTARIEEMEAHLDGCPVCVAQLDALTPSLSEDLWEAAREPVTPTPGWADHCPGWAEVGTSIEPAREGTLLFERKGKYKSHGPIAFGGMGEVYRAWEVGLERWVAIKIPSRTRRSPNAIARFLEEAPRQAQLEHPNIVRVYARDEEDGVPFFAMEFVTGETLAKASRESRLQPRRVAELVRQVATAVHSAHKVGVFHLDLKPANIMLTADGIPKVVDFGLARTLNGPTTHTPAKGAGTDEYMAPEQWEDDPECPREQTDVYGRTDVYGLGAVLYELLTGRPPFLRAAHRNETRRRVHFDEPLRPRALCKEVPRDLESICLRCLRKRPEDRYATAQEVADALGRFLDGYSIGECSWLTRLWYFVLRHRTLTTAACAGLLILTAVLGLFVSAWWRHQRDLALNVFDEGQKYLTEGRVTEGYNQMRSAIDLLPLGESVLRGYFTRNVASLKASLSREVARHNFPSEIQAAVASPDGWYMLVGDAAGRTTLWGLAENTTSVLPTRRGRERVSAVAFNKSGTLCASGGFDGEVIVWDVQSRQVHWIRQLDDLVRCLAFLGDGDRLLTGTLDRNGFPLRMWDMFRNGEKELRLETGGVGPETAGDLVVSSAGDRFVSVPAYSTNHCRLWDARTGRMLAELSDEAGTVSPRDKPLQLQAAFSADGSRLAVAGARLTIYDGRTGMVLRRVDAGRWERVHCVGWCDDGGVTLVVDTRDATVIRRMTPDLDVWDDVPMDHSENPAENTTFTARGLILTGRSTHMLRLLQPPPLSLPHADLGARLALAKVAVSGDGSRIATLTWPSGNSRGKGPRTEKLRKSVTSRLQVWEGRTLHPLSRIAELPEGHVAAAIAYGTAADTLAVGCLESDDQPHQAPVLLATLAPDGVLTFDRLGAHMSVVRAMAFTPDGKRLLTGSAPMLGDAHAELICWDLNARSAPLWRVRYPAPIFTITVSPDGTRVVVGGVDGMLRSYLINRPSEVLSTAVVGARIAAVAFAHSKPLIAVTQFTDRVHVFEVSDRSFVPRAQFDQPGAASSEVAFGPTDDILYVSGVGGVQRWDVLAKKRLDPVISSVDRVLSFGLNPWSEALIAVMCNGKMILPTVPNPRSVHRVVVGPRPTPVDPKRP